MGQACVKKGVDVKLMNPSASHQHLPPPSNGDDFAALFQQNQEEYQMSRQRTKSFNGGGGGMTEYLQHPKYNNRSSFAAATKSHANIRQQNNEFEFNRAQSEMLS